MTDSESEDSYQNYSGPNKVKDIVEDNRALRNAVRLATRDMTEKYHQILEFYEKLKVSAKNMANAYTQKQTQVNSQEKKIALLRAENFMLSQKAARMGIEELNIRDPSETNGTPGSDEAIKLEYEETVAGLTASLRKAEADLEKNTRFMSEQWQSREQQFKEEHKKGLQEIQAIFQMRLKEQQAVWELEKRKYEEENQAFKSQVTQLIAELRDNKKVTSNMEDTIEKYKSNSQKAESRIYQASRENEISKEKCRNLEAEVIRFKHEYEEMQRQKSDKEKSLDELFDVYNRLLEEKDNLQQKLDQHMARYLSAEESIKRRKDDNVSMKKRAENAESQITLYKQQADIFKRDFEMEREERQKTHNENDTLKNTLGKYQIEMQKMKQEILRHQERERTTYGNYGHG